MPLNILAIIDRDIAVEPELCSTIVFVAGDMSLLNSILSAVKNDYFQLS